MVEQAETEIPEVDDEDAEDDNPGIPGNGPKIDYTARERCLADIRDHLDKYGSTGWDDVRKRHPEVQVRSFWRYVAKVKRGAPGYTPDAKHFREVIQKEISKAQGAALSESIPHAPPPSVIANGGIEARRKMDFLTHLDAMMGDCNLLREFSMKEDKDGVMRIQNPLYFTQSVKLRVEVLNTAVSAMRHLWDLTKMQELYDAIIEEISHLDPKTAKLIVERLRELDDKRGMTFNARI